MTDAPSSSDDNLALAFTAAHGEDLRFVAAWSRWLRWDGARWEFDDTLAVWSLARAICREAAARLDNKPNEAKAVTSAKTVAAVERLARSDRKHAAIVDQWDADPWLLNTPGGTIDLRTGDLHLHRREDHITKITAVGPCGGCPGWREFLKRVTDGNDELQAFLQRMTGYALTGITREHALFFLHGIGANGKSTFLETISGIAGNYHTSAPMEVFMASHTDRHPTELAGLRGARLVTAVETEEGRRWAESRIKALTGGDTISARFVRQDYFEFRPEFKLLICGNHKPSLRSVDEAMRRRLHMLPFTVTIPPEERDDQLGEKLKAEWGGILEWMIEGVVEWGRTGLQPPEIVREATETYLITEDTIATWIEERCNTGPHFVAGSTDLYRAWKAWCDVTGEFAGTQKRFSQGLEDRGFEKTRLIGGRQAFRGIGLATINDDESEAQQWDSTAP